ncbi:hypothetical protein K470DRAFT_242747 [Piedraia hortae CBS 480.64]|uniref:Sulfate transporter family protein n=1 Tax=Piedraia hortae CBS 480.64 TaxID=1314780 RepID=A0A6A7C5K2_9PEZI|nr:hypothetical protein K470DRAFT_242747 [Piedraia hortae CBS 480.64]
MSRKLNRQSLRRQGRYNDADAEASIRSVPMPRARATSTSHGLSTSYTLPSRSYIHAGNRGPEMVQYASTGVREQSAEISSSFMTRELAGSDTPTACPESPQLPPDSIVEAVEDEDTEASPLLPRARRPSIHSQNHAHYPPPRAQRNDRLAQSTYDSISSVERQPTWRRPELQSLRIKGWAIIIRTIGMFPAVFLGVLLNLLDALSYGIILFPLGEEAFADLGPDGVSMFYVSCIIAQLTCSAGSIFRGGVGSEMIEVVPFFHKMTYLIMARMGTDRPDALRATTIASYAMSSIMTGLIFLILGSARLGTLVNFFPHSILTGCIGGVGIFLFVTGIEVSARLDKGLEFTEPTLRRLLAPDTIPLWIPPFALAVLLWAVKRRYDRPWLVPAYYIAITVIFYIITTAVPAITMDKLRASGWVFEAPAAGVPFYHFYTLYNFSLVDWGAIWTTIPSQLALTFFGILHVPINVPNLALVVQEDNVSINRELIVHGVSNTLSGALGSIQNYLVFVNSALFMETGGNSRAAGVLLAAATAGLWVAGPRVIGFVPVMVVGTLIYYLGIDLAVEALVGTYGKLDNLEYGTLVIIAVVMGMYDFVVGIGVGIGLACLVYVVQTSRTSVVRAQFSGAGAASAVRRQARQRHYLRRAGAQTRVLKLGGYLFFGSIVAVEKQVRALIDAEAFAAEPIRFLILDFGLVTGIDFSAAEAFNRMNRILHRRDVRMLLSSVRLEGDVGRSLVMVGLFEDGEIPPPGVFEDLNGALEACENELLRVLMERQLPQSKAVPIKRRRSSTPAMAASLRQQLLQQAATTAIAETRDLEPDIQPLAALTQAFGRTSERNAEFWARAVPYLRRRQLNPGEVVYRKGEQGSLFIIQSGVLQADYEESGEQHHESVMAGTSCGETALLSGTEQGETLLAERESIAWELTPMKWDEIRTGDADLAAEIMKLGLRAAGERIESLRGMVSEYSKTSHLG